MPDSGVGAGYCASHIASLDAATGEEDAEWVLCMDFLQTADKKQAASLEAASDASLQLSCVLRWQLAGPLACWLHCRVEVGASARSASATSRRDATTAGCATSVCSGEAGSLTHLKDAQAEQLKIGCLFPSSC